MAKGIIDRTGKVTVCWESQGEILAAPGGKIWLPCESCGEVQAVDLNVVSFLCDPCAKLRDECTGQCEECGRDVTDNRVYCEDCEPGHQHKGVDTYA